MTLFYHQINFSTFFVEKQTGYCKTLIKTPITWLFIFVEKQSGLGKTIHTTHSYPRLQICPHSYPHKKIVESVDNSIKSLLFYPLFVDK